MSGLFKSSDDAQQTQNTNQTQNSAFNNNTSSTFNNATGSTFGTNNSSTATPTAPDWVTAAIRAATGATTGLAGQNPDQFVAPANGYLTQAADRTSGLTGSPYNFDAAADETRYVMNAPSPRTAGVQASPFIPQYMDPYLDSVVKAASDDLSQSEGQARAQDDLALAGSGAFGGSGAAIQKALTEGNLARTRASTLAGLRSAGFSQALGAAQGDAQRQQGAKDLNAQLQAQQMDRALAASRQLGDLSTTYDANQRANAGAEAGVGDILQQIQQQRAAAPLTLAQFGSQNIPDLLRGFFGSTSNASSTGTSAGTSTGSSSGTSAGTSSGTSSGVTNASGSTTHNPSVMSDIGDILAIAAMFAG
jgi:hypothetical protein